MAAIDVPEGTSIESLAQMSETQLAKYDIASINLVCASNLYDTQSLDRKMYYTSWTVGRL